MCAAWGADRTDAVLHKTIKKFILNITQGSKVFFKAFSLLMHIGASQGHSPAKNKISETYTIFVVSCEPEPLFHL
jgi:hypothetical protein